MDRDRLLGLSKLRKGGWRLALDALGHTAIAFGCSLPAPFALAGFAGWGLGRCVLVGIATGALALLIREAWQWIDSGSPNLIDRALDLVPAPLGGALGGALAWWLASLLS